jgi:Predicted transcriptional regulators
MLLEEDIDLGREVVAKGKLKPLRESLGLTRSAMAELLYTTYPTYAAWESRPGTALWPASADRIGRFYRTATETIRLWDGDLKDLVPVHVVCTLLATPQEMVMTWYRLGLLDLVDLGILGLWIRKRDMIQLQADKRPGV